LNSESAARETIWLRTHTAGAVIFGIFIASDVSKHFVNASTLIYIYTPTRALFLLLNLQP
jgi:hypothetical protein